MIRILILKHDPYEEAKNTIDVSQVEVEQEDEYSYFAFVKKSKPEQKLYFNCKIS